MRKIPPDAPEADVLEQAREWSDEGPVEPPEIPGDAPEADVLDQQRPSPLDDEGRAASMTLRWSCRAGAC